MVVQDVNLARKQDIDAVAGLMILWMVIGHLRQVCGYEWQSPNILYFFMPWFYYKAGMLWKDGDVRNVATRGGAKTTKAIRGVCTGRANHTDHMFVDGKCSEPEAVSLFTCKKFDIGWMCRRKYSIVVYTQFICSTMCGSMATE